MDPARPSHDRVAWCYDAIASAYSGGAIRAAKIAHLAELNAGDRVLYVGVGSGEDALLALRRGVQVSALDVSRRMLTRCSRRFDAEGLHAEILCEDLFRHDRFGSYDAVAANFVLNLFPDPLMRDALAQLTRLLKPGGKLLVADFAALRGEALRDALARAYYRPVNLAARVLGLCSLHPIYDYVPLCAALGLAVHQRREHRIFGRGPALFESWVALRPAC